MATYTEDTYMWLCSQFPDFYTVDFDANQTLIAGKPQAGKSEFTFGLALMLSLRGMTPLMILRNFSKDAVQMASKLDRFSQRHKEFMIRKGWPEKEVETKAISSVLAVDDLRDLSAGIQNRKLVFVLYNGYQLNLMNILCERIAYGLLVDEADAVGYGEIKEGDTRPRYHASWEYQCLMDGCRKIFEISATVFDILWGNTNIETNNIVVIRPPETYKGIRNGVQFVALEHKINAWRRDGDLDDSDPNMFAVYGDLSRLPIYMGARYNCVGTHPIIMLHKSYIWQAHHDEFMKSFREHPEFADTWTIIIEDSRAFQIYSPHLKRKQITLDGEIQRDKLGNGYYKFLNPNLDIQMVLQWFKQNGGAEIFSHIIVKTGHQAGRSRSYVSLDGGWHLTHEYLAPSRANRNTADLIQAVRLCHNRPDSIPLTLYTPEAVAVAIQKADMLQDEQLERLRHINAGIQAWEYMMEDIWAQDKIPRYRVCRSKNHRDFKLKVTDGDDGGWNTANYVSALEQQKEGKYILIEQEKFTKGTIVWKLVGDMESLLIQNCRIAEDVPVTWVNQKLRELPHWSDKTEDGIHGALWTSIRKNKGLTHSHTKPSGQLVFWKTGQMGYVKLT